MFIVVDNLANVAAYRSLSDEDIRLFILDNCVVIEVESDYAVERVRVKTYDEDVHDHDVPILG